METQSEVAAGGLGMFGLVWVAVSIVLIAAIWKVFTKAGQPGWGCIIPFYNVLLLLKIAGKPGWWLVLFFIPIVNLVVAILTSISVANRFGKGGGFAAGMILLPIIFYPILGFGSATYQPQVAAA